MTGIRKKTADPNASKANESDANKVDERNVCECLEFTMCSANLTHTFISVDYF